MAKIAATRQALAAHDQRTDLLLTLASLNSSPERDASVWSVLELQTHLKSLMSSIDVWPQAGEDKIFHPAKLSGNTGFVDDWPERKRTSVLQSAPCTE